MRSGFRFPVGVSRLTILQVFSEVREEDFLAWLILATMVENGWRNFPVAPTPRRASIKISPSILVFSEKCEMTFAGSFLRKNCASGFLTGLLKKTWTSSFCCRSSAATTKPSPALPPLPQKICTFFVRGNFFLISRAAAMPAFRIRVLVGTPRNVAFWSRIWLERFCIRDKILFEFSHKMLKRIALTFFTFIFAFAPVFAVGNDSGISVKENYELTSTNYELSKTPVNVFVREKCAHCQDEEEFLDELQKERNDFEVFYHDIGEAVHYVHFDELTSLEKIPKATPITLVGNMIIQGFGSANSTGVRIREILDISQGKATLNFAEFIAAGGSGGNVETVTDGTCEDSEEVCAIPESRYLVDIPFFGAVDVAQYSLPMMAVVLGFIDGFNPCAMWVLVTFLIVLLQIGDRRKMFQIASLFILAEAVMYFLILNVWFTAWDFVGLDGFVTPLVGLIAVGGGVFFLYEGLTSDGTCKVTNPEQRAKIHSKIKDLVARPMTWVTILSILALAFSVNVIEFACSIGIPQAFTKILDMNLLSTFREQVLILIYTLFYMVDDVIVFGIALAGVEKLGVTHKYSKYSNLIGGVLMLLLGALLIFAPEVLRFG